MVEAVVRKTFLPIADLIGREARVALVMCTDKSDSLETFVRGLHEMGFKFLSTSGTARTIEGYGLPVYWLEDLVGEELLGGLVKSISREVYAGLLAPPTEEVFEELESRGIPFIEVACVDCYRLEEEIEREGSTIESVRLQTDVGGPGSEHAAAKGRRIVIADPADRLPTLERMQAGTIDDEYRQELAAKADFMAAKHIATSAVFLGRGRFNATFSERVLECGYGEDPSQSPAALYSIGSSDPLALDKLVAVAGKAPSYNNLCDIDRMLQTITHIAAVFEKNRGVVPKIAVAVKHGNPCGAAVGDDPATVITKMVSGDMRAIFGGLVMTNFSLGPSEAEILLHFGMPEGKRRVLDGVVAPNFDPSTVELYRRKEDKCRLLANPALGNLGVGSLDVAPRRRYVRGGELIQPNYTYVLDLYPDDEETDYVTLHGPSPNRESLNDALLAWAICATSNSNTITLVRDSMLIGNGVGQQDRVGCCELAVKRAKDAGHEIAGASACSDAYFPFPDGPEVLSGEGVKTILTTSGSDKDRLTIDLCKERGVTLLMVPTEIGRLFFGH